MQKITIYYNADMNKPYWCNHTGQINTLLSVDSKIFYDIDDALNFICQCSYPITTAEEILNVENPYINYEETLEGENLQKLIDNLYALD